MNWSNEAWHSIESIYKAIQKMPFIEKLRKGTLEMENFQYYLKQDSLYLEDFSRALAMIAAKLPDIKDTQAFIEFSQGAIAAEVGLHEAYFTTYNVKDRGEMLPACHHYTSFLKSAVVTESLEVAMAAVLPCFWIYKEIGDYIYKNRVEDQNPFTAWIETYAGEEFGESVRKAIEICDRYAKKTSVETRKKMTKAFIYASQLEFDFWDAADQLRDWKTK